MYLLGYKILSQKSENTEYTSKAMVIGNEILYPSENNVKIYVR